MLKTEARVSADNIKAKYIEDEVQATASLTLIREKQSAISKVLKHVDHVRFIHNIYFQNLVKMDVFGVEDDLSWNVYLV